MRGDWYIPSILFESPTVININIPIKSIQTNAVQVSKAIIMYVKNLNRLIRNLEKANNIPTTLRMIQVKNRTLSTP